MASLKAIRKRILSVRSTQQITKAMKMVAAARLRRAQEAAIAARGYSTRLAELAAVLRGQGEGDREPLLAEPAERGRVAVVLVSSDRGLCGGYNSNLFRRVEAFLGEVAVAEVPLTVVGRKGVEYFRRRGYFIRQRYSLQGGTSPEQLAARIASEFLSAFAAGEVAEVLVAYNRFRSALSQVPVVERLVPVELPEPRRREEYLIEPGLREVFGRLLPRLVEVRLRQAFLEATASEHGARMTAMENATNNAGEMIERLTLVMNQARQAMITKELMEIVSGAEALKG